MKKIKVKTVNHFNLWDYDAILKLDDRLHISLGTVDVLIYILIAYLWEESSNSDGRQLKMNNHLSTEIMTYGIGYPGPGIIETGATIWQD